MQTAFFRPCFLDAGQRNVENCSTVKGECVLSDSTLFSTECKGLYVLFLRFRQAQCYVTLVLQQTLDINQRLRTRWEEMVRRWSCLFAQRERLYTAGWWTPFIRSCFSFAKEYCERYFDDYRYWRAVHAAKKQEPWLCCRMMVERILVHCLSWRPCLRGSDNCCRCWIV